MKRALRKWEIEYEADQQDIAELIRHLGVTVPAARCLLTNTDPVAVRAQIEQLGAHLTSSKRAELIARISHTQRCAARRHRQAHA
jgi:hypothetical protein